MAINDETAAFHERLAQIETLISETQAAANPALRANVETLVQTLLELHGAGIERMMDIVWETGSVGEKIIHQDLPKDELVSSLLLLHNLHPLPIEDRVQGALEKVRPYLKSHGGNVEIVDIANGLVRLKLQGSCEVAPLLP